jgi:AcrR family transcriptional regulator
MPLNDAAARDLSPSDPAPPPVPGHVTGTGAAQRALALSPKGMRTRRRLIDGARQAFENSGSYVDTRIADIVRVSGVAYGSFYTYFDSKEELFHELAVMVVDELFAEGTSAYRGADSIERLGSAHRRFLAAYRRRATLLSVIDQAAALYPGFRTLRQDLRSRFVEGIAAHLRQLIAQGRADSRLDPEAAAQVLVSTTDNFGQLWSALTDASDEEKALTTLGVLWANAVGASH